MRLKIQDGAPSFGRRRLCLAFLHEARNPAAGAPAAVRAELEEACRASAFRGRDREVAGALTEHGGWVLIGLGSPGSPLGKLRKAVRRGVKDALRQPGRGLLLAFGDGITREHLR